MSDTNKSDKKLLDSVFGDTLIITCPITKKAFDDPVLASDKITYERKAIEKHF